MAQEPALSRRRSWLVWGLVVVATILLLVSSLTVWTKRQLLDTDAWTSAAGEILADDDVRSAVSTQIADLLNQRIDFKAELEQRLPPQTRSFAPVAAAGVQAAIPRVLETFLATPRAQKLWEDINRRAHAAIVNVLEGKDAGPVSTSNGDVVLDLRPMIGAVVDRLGLSGARLKQGASETTGQIVLLRSDQLDAAQKTVRVVKALSIFLLIVVLAFYALAVYLAHGRRRTVLRGVGIGLFVVGLILLVVQRLIGNYIVDSVVTVDANRPAVHASWFIETELLRDIAWALVAYGIVTIIATVLAGPARLAVRLRRAAAPTVRDHVLLFYTAAAIVVLAFLAWGPAGSSRRLLGDIVLGVLFFAGLEVWRRQAVRELGPGEPAKAP